MKKTIKNYLNNKKIEKMGEEFLSVIKESETYFRKLSDNMGEILNKYEIDYVLDDMNKLVDSGKLKQVSSSWIQRRHKIGYARSARIMDEFAKRKVIKPDPLRAGIWLIR